MTEKLMQTAYRQMSLYEKLIRHHWEVEKRFPDRVLMTVLVGSQNYELDHANSDIDTFSFLLPTVEQVCFRDSDAGEFELDDGKCIYKDFFATARLLMKPSPNSIEWFLSPIKTFTTEYENVIDDYWLQNPNSLIHTDFHHMLMACAGMSKQLSKRNMNIGKRYAHALRLKNLWESYYGMDISGSDILRFRSEEDRVKALEAKTSGINPTEAERAIHEVDLYFDDLKKTLDLNTTRLKTIEAESKQAVLDLCSAVFKRWKELN